MREKRIKQKIISMSSHPKFVSTFSGNRKENELSRKYTLLEGPAEKPSSPTISQIDQNL